jgi:hypothetical protein
MSFVKGTSKVESSLRFSVVFSFFKFIMHFLLFLMSFVKGTSKVESSLRFFVVFSFFKLNMHFLLLLNFVC